MAELWAIYNWVASAKGRGFSHVEIIKFDSMTALFHFWHGAPQIQKKVF